MLNRNVSRINLKKMWEMCEYEGFWIPAKCVEEARRFRSSFEAGDDDVFLTSFPKTGTGWLKSISFSILKNQELLTTDSPYSLVPTLVSSVTRTNPLPYDPYDAASSPRLLHTHVPYSLLPDSLKNSACKIIYITRNPKDTVISMWHFFNSFAPDPMPLPQMVDMFCSGAYPFGPFFDHVAEYWAESKKRPEKILFVRYEELKSDTTGHISMIAEFLGKPFANEEEANEIKGRCSIQRLKNLEVNKSGSFLPFVPNSAFLRKEDVGDYNNYLTPEMQARIDEISRLKLEPLGLFL